MIDSVEKYRYFDMVLLTILAIVAQIMGDLLHDALPGAGFYLNFSILVALVAIIRWGKWGSLVFVISGLPMLFLHHGNIIESILLYPFANAFIIFTCLIFRVVDRDHIKDTAWNLLVYCVTAYLFISIGKGIVTYFLAGGFIIKNIVYYFLTQLFNMIMVFIILLLIKSKAGLLDNMHMYLLKYNQEEHYE